MKSKKGISQVLAYTILIGLAVALGTFVTVWYKGAAEEQAETILVPYATGAECSQVNVNVNFSFGDCKVRIYNAGTLKFNQMEILAPYWPDGTFLYETELMPKEWAELDVPGLDDRIILEIFPIIEIDGNSAKCQKNKQFDSGSAFSCL